MELGTVVYALRTPCAHTQRGVSLRGTTSRLGSIWRPSLAATGLFQRPKHTTLRGSNRLLCEALSSDRDLDSLLGDSLFQQMDRTFSEVDRMQQDLELSIRRDMQRMERDMEQIRQQPGARTFSQSGNIEERLGDGGYAGQPSLSRALYPSIQWFIGAR